MKLNRAAAQPARSSGHPLGSPKRRGSRRASALTLAAVLGLVVAIGPSAEAQTFTVLYSFSGYPTDGDSPIGGLFMDANGNLYGTTTYGGSNKSCPGTGVGCGTVFKLDTKGNETVLYNFAGPDGANPSGSLIMNAKGDLYGTTEYGGRLQDCTSDGFAGCGVVFKLRGKKETVLHRFCSVGNCTDGAEHWRGLVMDASGAVYGTTYYGGSVNGGAVFRLVGKKETVLHSFTGYPDGAYPEAGLITDANGNLFGTTIYGGDFNCDDEGGCGVVFKLADKKETILYRFKGSDNPGSRDGAYPAASLFMDANGNLYGTTADGGDSDNQGTVFEVSHAGKEHVLYRFIPQHNVFGPQSRVIRDAEGNLYGTTLEGGGGTVFEVSKDRKEKVLHYFCSEQNCADGGYPAGDLIMDAKGNLYGTAYGGGINGNGTIFMITP
ncbi:MAG TPA: choice-of-anchor tandem repeat GloVer-containing protein [Terriglobales bacterium]|nr:choice-of-anchor tandem repeat GloVer-containing protein [Terriglobales bacterium]